MNVGFVYLASSAPPPNLRIGPSPFPLIRVFDRRLIRFRQRPSVPPASEVKKRSVVPPAFHGQRRRVHYKIKSDVKAAPGTEDVEVRTNFFLSS
jgi:hypothetical protein